MQEPPLFQLYSTVLRVRNLETSLDWYERVLGFAVHFHDPHYRLRMLQDSHGRLLTLWEIEDGIAPISAQRNGSYLVFATADIEAARIEVLRRGGDAQPVGAFPGLCLFWLPDPDGHCHAFMQFMPE